MRRLSAGKKVSIVNPKPIKKSSSSVDDVMRRAERISLSSGSLHGGAMNPIMALRAAQEALAAEEEEYDDNYDTTVDAAAALSIADKEQPKNETPSLS